MKILVFALSLFFLFEGCDKIDGPFSQSVIIQGGDTLQKVLLEEYTGHQCPNCPTAHNQAQTLLNTYGNQLVVISIHAGYYAQTSTGTYSYDFRTQVGNDLLAFFLPPTQSFPTGIIQRKKSSTGDYPISYSNWGAIISPLISAKPSVMMKLNNSYNTAAQTITTTVTADILKDLSSSLTLSVLYTEDSIVKPQKDHSVNVLDYVHRHVLRGTLNGSWGESIGNSFTKGQSINKTYTSAPIQTDIIPEHVSVIAILYNTSTIEVVQVEEKKLIE